MNVAFDLDGQRGSMTIDVIEDRWQFLAHLERAIGRSCGDLAVEIQSDMRSGELHRNGSHVGTFWRVA